MEIRVLGPIEARHSETALHLGRRQPRLILGILALEANQLVASDRLIDLLWGDAPPVQARAVLHSRVSEVRAALYRAGVPTDIADLSTSGRSYVLRMTPACVDAHRFREMVATYDRDPDESIRIRLRTALDMWRGPVLEGGLPEATHLALCQPLEALKLTATENLFEVELRLGHHHRVADEIQQAVGDNPTRERLIGQLMIALHGSGRTADAVREYDKWRRWLRDELGLDPGTEVQQLYVALLRGDHPQSLGVVGDRPTAEVPVIGQRDGDEAVDLPSEAPGFKVPHTLPPDAADFTGREQELRYLGEVIASSPGGPAVVALTGPGGVGKTALAIHLAHSLKAQFPDGQLYADLRGDEPEPPDPADVVSRFLRAFGVNGDAMPRGAPERLDLYRDLLASRRVVLVLDNVADDRQVTPLLPSGQQCAALVTSRSRVGATIGAHIVGLDVLSASDAAQLIGQIAGRHHVDAEPLAVAELCLRCGHLPLAVRIVAARLAAKPHWTAAKLVGMLEDESSRLDQLVHGVLDVRASIAVSYNGLGDGARRLLRRFADVCLPAANPWMAAALLDVDLVAADDTLEELFDAQLVHVTGTEPFGQARYRMHDLVSLFARERSADESVADLGAARDRLLHAWLHLGLVAHRSIYGDDYRDSYPSEGGWAPPSAVVESVTAEPYEWFEVERESIIAAVALAARSGNSQVGWRLVRATYSLFDMGRYFDDLVGVLTTALALTIDADDTEGQAAMHCQIGGVNVDREEYALALDRFHEAGRLYGLRADGHGRARVDARLAMVQRLKGNDQDALDLYLRALPDLRDAGDYVEQAMVLRAIGQIHGERGDYEDAETCFAAALGACRISGSRRRETQVLFWRGMLRLREGQVAEARAEFEQVLERCRSANDVPGEAYSLKGLAMCFEREGDRARAHAMVSEALHRVRQPVKTKLEQDLERYMDNLSETTGA